MTLSIFLIAAILAVLQIKQGFCDYVLQNSYQLLNEGTYLRSRGLIHARLRALLTTATSLIIAPTLALGVCIVVVEFLIQ